MMPHLVIADLGFPLWLRITHFINLLFIGLVIRSGIQILGAHPRLYFFNEGCKPGTEWIRFTRKKIPKDKLYTSMDDEIPVSSALALPGGDNLGLGRHWHFFCILFWILNGVIYVILLFATGEWVRLIPTSWTIFPHAWDSLLTYLTLHIPPHSEFTPYEPLQQLAYAAVVFLLAPFLIVTGAAQSPAIEGRFPWYVKLFGGRQTARSLHFLGMLGFVAFTLVHTLLVFLVYAPDNVQNMVMGGGNSLSNLTEASVIGVLALLFVFFVYVLTSFYSLRHKRKTQNALGAVIEPVRHLLLHREHSAQYYKPSERTSYFWVNGRPPETEEYRRLMENNFADWRLEISGLCVNPLSLSLDDLRKLPRQSQITRHNCIQGWTGIAEWAGVPMTEILELCGALPEAKYVVFTSYQHGKQSYPETPEEYREHPFFEIIDMELASHPQTILAYEMNGKPLPLEHGAPLRLRVETQLGYKMVKWLHSIQLVADYSDIGEGQGGFREDIQYYAIGASI
jgi:sulfoxide reductase catalytic subunit YedY